MVSQAASLIYDLFVTSREEARAEAEGLLSLFAAHGTESPDWGAVENAIHKHVGARLEWRDPRLQARVEQDRRATAEAYDEHLNRVRGPWRPKR